MIDKMTIQRQFYEVYKGLIDISEFEEWLYNTQEISTIFGEEFYFNLINLDYRKKYIKNELVKLIEKAIPFNELEQVRICMLLKEIISDKGDVVEILEQLYEDYCHGYLFLRYLGLTYITGIDDIPKLKQKDKWDKKAFESKREILNEIKPKIVNEAKRLFSFLQGGQIKITGENEYCDYRKEEEKVELININKMLNQ